MHRSVREWVSWANLKPLQPSLYLTYTSLLLSIPYESLLVVVIDRKRLSLPINYSRFVKPLCTGPKDIMHVTGKTCTWSQCCSLTLTQHICKLMGVLTVQAIHCPHLTKLVYDTDTAGYRLPFNGMRRLLDLTFIRAFAPFSFEGNQLHSLQRLDLRSEIATYQEADFHQLMVYLASLEDLRNLRITPYALPLQDQAQEVNLLLPLCGLTRY